MEVSHQLSDSANGKVMGGVTAINSGDTELALKSQVNRGATPHMKLPSRGDFSVMDTNKEVVYGIGLEAPLMANVCPTGNKIYPSSDVCHLSDLQMGLSKEGFVNSFQWESNVERSKATDGSVQTSNLHQLSMERMAEVTPKCTQIQRSDCQFAGKKVHGVGEEDSRHSRWEEFRKFASRDAATEECSTLLKRMELEASDDEEETLRDEDMISLEESGLLPNTKSVINEDQIEADKKAQKRKPGWGPILRIPRPRRVPDDGRTVLERAQELKKIINLEKGNNYASSFAFKSNTSLNDKATSVGIELGSDNQSINETVDGLKQKELENLNKFMENNPEVNLPANLNIDVESVEFPPLMNSIGTLSGVFKEYGSQSWAQVVSKDNAVDNLENITNDRCILERERP